MKCPGQDSRNWKPGDIFEAPCPACGASVEFFKDEPQRKCRKCGQRLANPRLDFGCAAYCRFADQCLGELPPELLAGRQDLLKDRVAVEMKRYFGRDFKRIGHATRVARYAEQIARDEGGELAVVLCAAYLHDIGIKEAERKYDSSAARYQETEGPPVARQIMSSLGAGDALIEEVCDIVGHHHHPRPDETVNFKCVYDADLIVNREEAREKFGTRGMEEASGKAEGAGQQEGCEQAGTADKARLAAWVEKVFLTEGGRRLAATVFLKDSGQFE